MKLERAQVYVGKVLKNNDGFVGLFPAECVSFMWEVTSEFGAPLDEITEKNIHRNMESA